MFASLKTYKLKRLKPKLQLLASTQSGSIPFHKPQYNKWTLRHLITVCNRGDGGVGVYTARYTPGSGADGLDSPWHKNTTTGGALLQMGTQVGIRQGRGPLPGLCRPCSSE